MLKKRTLTAPPLTDFVPSTIHQETVYENSFSLPITRRVLYIPSSASRKRDYKIALQLIGRHLQLYVALDKVTHRSTPLVHYVKRNSPEFFKLLATSSHIVTERLLYLNFSPRDGQTVLSTKQFRVKRLDPSNTALITNLKVDRIISGEGIASNIIKSIQNSSNDDYSIKQNRILFILEPKRAYLYLEIINSVTKWIDMEHNRITIIMSDRCFKEHESTISQLDSRIEILVKRGLPLCLHDESKAFEYLKTYDKLLPENFDFTDILTRDFFMREHRRLFGRTKFDVVYNLGGRGFYWIAFAGSMNAKRYLLLENGYNIQKTDYQTWTLRVRRLYTDALFQNYDQLDANYAFVEEPLASKAKVLGYVPVNEIEHNPTLTPFHVDDKALLCWNMKERDVFDGYSIDAVGLFPDGELTYLVVDNSRTSEEWVALIDAVSKWHPIGAIFDFYALVSDSRVAIPIYRNKDLYKTIITRFACCCYAIGSSIGIYHEATIAERNIIVVDFSGEEVQEFEASPYSIPDARYCLL